jgi:AmpD protein
MPPTPAAPLFEHGWYRHAARRPSPHADARPPGSTIDLLVLHNISLPAGRFGGEFIDALFRGTLDCAAHPDFASLQGLRVSAHFLVRRDGALLQYVSCAERAWHAGVSRFEGRTRCNDFSIGIELEGCDSRGFEPAQYESLHSLVGALLEAYPIRAIAGHADIAPGRKTDPGPGFDWVALRRASGLGASAFPFQPA